MPRLHGRSLAYGLQRWEIVVPEAATLRILGAAEPGLCVDAAMSEPRFDAARTPAVAA